MGCGVDVSVPPTVCTMDGMLCISRRGGIDERLQGWVISRREVGECEDSDMMDLKVIASSCGMPMNDIPIYSNLVLHSVIDLAA